MRKLFIVLVSAFILLNFYACSGSSESVVAEYGNDSITMDEFKEAYNKNLADSYESLADTTKDKKEFLDLFVNYKMKLSDAHARGFDTNPEIQSEIDDYMRTVGIPYVQEKYVIDPGLKDLYEKRKRERKVKHILIRKKSENDEKSGAVAQALLDSILAGADFESVAFDKSEDQFSKPDSGNIYWLTAGQTIPPFDEALFNTEVGTVYPEVVKTNFGYHIIKVDSEQTRKYEVKARHILAAFQKGGNVDSAAALEKIELVEQKLKEGEDFAELAKEYSDDPGSAAKGGELGFFRRRMMVEPFDEAAFTLGVGEVSKPIETKYGYHIIEVQDIKDYPSYEDEEDNLKKLYEKNYFPYYADKYLDTLKQEYNFEMNDSIYAKLKNEGEDLIFNSTYWDSELNKEIGDSTLYSFNSNIYSVDEVITDIDSTHKLRSAKMTAKNVERAVQDQVGDKLYIQKAIDLNNSDTEFAQLMEDYKKGLYIFKLQEEEIWDKLDNDSTKLVAYYEETKDNYVLPDRASFSAIFRKDSSVIYDDYFAIQDGAVFDTIVAKNLTLPSYKKNTGVRELTNVEDSELAAKAFELENEGDISEPFKVDNGWYIVKLIIKDPARIKTFEEAKSEVSSAWMEKESKRLEATYLNKLKELYHPKLYYDKLSEMDSDKTNK